MLSNDVGTCEWLVAELDRTRVLERALVLPHLAQFRGQNPYSDATGFAEFLVGRGVLTAFQATRVLDGEARKLVLGPYVLAEPVGVGSLGTVYRAVGRADRRDYAVKVLPLRSQWNVRLVRNQVRSFTSLPSHECVVPFLDVGTAGGVHYLVWPFVTGETVEQAVQRRGPLPPEEVAYVGLEVADALAACHPRGLFHGLIKPSNLLIGDDGRVRLLDFGIGALLSENLDDDDAMLDTVSQAQAAAGMIDCASPESLVDPARRTPAGDQYSLGCVLYFCATGRYPFALESLTDKMLAHQTQTAKPARALNPAVPKELSAIIEGLMQKSPQARYHRIDEVVALLAPLARPGPTPPPQAPSVPPPIPVDAVTPRPSSLTGLSVPKSRPASSPPQPVPEPEPAPELPAPVPPPAASGKERGSLSGALGRMLFWRKSRDLVRCTVVLEGTARPGKTVMLHVYAHRPDETPDVRALAGGDGATLRVLAEVETTREVARGTRIGLHIGIEAAAVAQPTREIRWAGRAAAETFAAYLPANCPVGPVPVLLMVGQDGKLIGQTDFTLPVASGRG